MIGPTSKEKEITIEEGIKVRYEKNIEIEMPSGDLSTQLIPLVDRIKNGKKIEGTDENGKYVGFTAELEFNSKNVGYITFKYYEDGDWEVEINHENYTNTIFPSKGERIRQAIVDSSMNLKPNSKYVVGEVRFTYTPKANLDEVPTIQ